MSRRHRRAHRPDSAGRKPGQNLEVLETRQLLTQSPYLPLSAYPLNDFPVSGASDPGRVPVSDVNHAIGAFPHQLASYQNQGKVITGQDRQGNQYKLTLTGPGSIIVTDATPNDGVLDDDINTIQLVGTNASSVLTGQVIESNRAPSSYTQLPTLGQVKFNSLIANNAVKRITLNGFVLTDTVTPVGSVGLNSTTGINLKRGVGRLEFQGIDARFPASQVPSPILIQIGGASTPLKVKPDIRIDSINNTVYDDTAFLTGGSGLIPTGPLTMPSVRLIVNGDVASFNVVSITQTANFSGTQGEINGGTLNLPVQLIPNDSAALAYQFPIVGTTGRTAVQANSIRHIRSTGSLVNTTFSKSATPFQNSLTGLNSVGSVKVGGQSDALAIDSAGSIHDLTFSRGLGNPTGVSQNPIYYGTPANTYGYPANGLVGGQVVTEGNIGSVRIGTGQTFTQTSQDPAKIQLGMVGTETTIPRPGTAVQSAVVVAGGSIGQTGVIGDIRNSQISAGQNYYSAQNGVEGVTGASSIGPAKIRGDLVDTVVSSSYRSNDGIYGNGNDTAGPGVITGTQKGLVYKTPAGTTAAGTKGSGFFAATVSGATKKV